MHAGGDGQRNRLTEIALRMLCDESSASLSRSTVPPFGRHTRKILWQETEIASSTRQCWTGNWFLPESQEAPEGLTCIIVRHTAHERPVSLVGANSPEGRRPWT